MPSAKTIATILVAVTIGAVLMTPIMSTINDNTGEVDVTDEELTAANGSWQDLDGYSIVSGSETVEYRTNTSDSWTEATSTDYELDEEAGEIRFTDAGNVSEGDYVSINYTYEATDSTTTTVLGIVPVLVALLLLVSLASKVQGGL